MIETPNKLSPANAAKFYALFLQGYSCEEIAKLNPDYGSLGLSLITRARIEYDWDAEKEEYVLKLMESVKQSVEKMTLEGIQFTSDGMAVFHKLMGDRFRKFLQTGDPEHLGDFKGMSFKTYREFVQLFQSMTGQDGANKKPAVDLGRSTEIGTGVQPGPGEGIDIDDSKPISAEDAESMLKLLS